MVVVMVVVIFVDYRTWCRFSYLLYGITLLLLLVVLVVQ